MNSKSAYQRQSSARLDFRPATLDDIPDWAPFFQNKDYLHFLAIPEPERSGEALATKWITMQFDRYQDSGFGHLAVIERSSGAFIGMGGIIPRQLKWGKVYEIAYSLKPNYWGQGYATELAQTMRKFSLDHGLEAPVVSLIHKDNIGSIRVAEKNGMKRVDEIDDYIGIPVWVYGYTNMMLD